MRSAWTLTLAPGAPFRWEVKGVLGRVGCWWWVVSVPLGQLRFLIGSEAGRWSEGSGIVQAGLKGQGGMGSDCPCGTAAFQMSLIPDLHSEDQVCLSQISIFTVSSGHLNSLMYLMFVFL